VGQGPQEKGRGERGEPIIPIGGNSGECQTCTLAICEKRGGLVKLGGGVNERGGNRTIGQAINYRDRKEGDLACELRSMMVKRGGTSRGPMRAKGMFSAEA